MSPDEPIRVRARHPRCLCSWDTDEVEWFMTALHLDCPVHQHLVRQLPATALLPPPVVDQQNAGDQDEAGRAEADQDPS